MSVDFSLPWIADFETGDTVYVPIVVLKKRVLHNFDLTDAAGRSLVVLTTNENGRVATLGLESLLWPVVQARQRELTQALIETVGEADEDKAVIATARALSDGVLHDALGGLESTGAGHAPTALTVRGLIKELGVGFLLLAPMTYEPGTRQIVKFSYDASRKDGKAKRQDWPADDRFTVEQVFGQAPRQSAAKKYRDIRRVVSQTGLAARLEDIEDLQLGWSKSYHVELVPPGDMRVVESALELKGDRPLRDNNRFRPHMHVSNCSRDAVGQVSLSLHAQRDALVFPLAFSGAVIAGLLSVLAHRAPASIDKQTVAAVLVLPSALAAYYVRGSEHTYVTNALRGLRLIAIIPVAMGLFVLGMLGLGYLDVGADGKAIDPDAVHWLRVASGAAVGSAMLLVAALPAPLAGSFARKVARRAEDSLFEKSELTKRIVGSALALGGVIAWLAFFGGAAWALYCKLGI